ncbi:MAG: tetratricopeptide repeat protein, partial [Candidatus Dormibacteraceae bacterium]
PLQSWVERDNGDPAARIALVQCYVKSRMAQAADSETRKFLALPRASTAQKLQLAKSLDHDKAANLEQEVLRNAVSTSPDSAQAHAMLGTLLANEHHFEEAGQQLWDAAKLSPDSPQYSMQFAATLLLWKRYSTALKFLMLVKDRFGNLPEYQYKLALTYYDLAEYPRAIARLERLAQRSPNLEMVQYYLGNCYYSQGDFATAERYYRRAIQLDPHNAVFYAAMGQLLRKVIPPRTDEAIEALQKALKLDPSNSEAQLYLALCFEGKKEFAQAVPVLQQAIHEQPGLVAAHVALARAYYRLNRTSEGDRERAIIARLGSVNK